MARLARVVVPHIPHHIIQRGNRRQNIFFSDEDRLFYLDCLKANCDLRNVDIWSYCLMDNHVHLVAVPKDEYGLAGAIGETHRNYTRRINFRNGWRGYLWQGRFISYPMDEKHLLAAVRYIERNPVRAGVVEEAEKFRWSSARAHVSGYEDELLSGEEIEILKIDDWKSYLMEADDEIDIKRFRKHSNTGRPLGDNGFIEKLEMLTGRNLRKRKPGPKTKN